MSNYEMRFDGESRHWSEAPDFNLMFLKTQENYFNDILKTRGHVFLNEVYGALGFNHTPAGAVIGWTLSKLGDSYIQIEIKEIPLSGGGLLLDFNVDGFILDKLGKRR